MATDNKKPSVKAAKAIYDLSSPGSCPFSLAPIIADATGCDDQAAEIARLRAENKALRRHWCFAHAGHAAYMDDGEAHDCRERPFIDFLRDPLDEIVSKLKIRSTASK